MAMASQLEAGFWACQVAEKALTNIEKHSGDQR